MTPENLSWVRMAVIFNGVSVFFVHQPRWF